MNPQDNQNENQVNNSAQNNAQGQDNSMHNDPVREFTKGNNNNMVMGILSYLGPLVLIPYLTVKDNDFVKFHSRQGLVLFGIEVIVWLLGSMMYSMWMITNLLNLATLILTVIGIVNVVQGNKKELPVIGGLAKNFNL
ncbi:MAG: hypothetical protein CEO12_357 [Parcubacteria group bacterium Gr01-1014_46]|nr:MAG: hypothetical protein CEO12_357 [Parcubacteria group bacterium Gr01-1014_46]